MCIRDSIKIIANLVAAYHKKNQLKEKDLDLLFIFLKMRLAVSVINSTMMAKENPDDPYITISQGPAWRFLEQEFDPNIVLAKLRIACGFEVVKNSKRILAYLKKNCGNFSNIFNCDLVHAPMVDLSVFGTVIPENPFNLTLNEATKIGADINVDYWLGFWGEPRLIYTSHEFRTGKYNN